MKKSILFGWISPIITDCKGNQTESSSFMGDKPNGQGVSPDPRSNGIL